MSEPALTPVFSKDTRTSPRQMPLYRVLLHNDDVNDMIEVAEALCKTFGFERHLAFDKMIEAHKTGVALCNVSPLEHAELYRDQLASFSLTATIEPEE